MSLILDALKKLERERSARSGEKVDVAGEILRTRDGKPRSRTRVVLIGLAAAAFAVAAVTLALTLGPNLWNRQVPSAPEERNVTPAPAAQTSAMPAISEKVDEKASSVTPGKSGPSAVVAAPGKRDTGRDAAAHPGTGKRIAPKEEEAPAREAAAGKPSTEMKITGIVWEEDRRARRAFINGHVASEGSVIEGAKVTEIRPNSVKFSQGGRTFEVQMFQ